MPCHGYAMLFDICRVHLTSAHCATDPGLAANERVTCFADVCDACVELPPAEAGEVAPEALNRARRLSRAGEGGAMRECYRDTFDGDLNAADVCADACAACDVDGGLDSASTSRADVVVRSLQVGTQAGLRA
jgi:hypothetical protein